MATAKKTTSAAKTSAAANAPTKRAAAAKKSSKPATAAKKATTAAKKTATAAAPAKKAAQAPTSNNGSGAAMKPIKSGFTKSALIAHLAQASGVDAKAAKAVMASLEATVLASVHKRGLGEFTLPGLLKVNVLQIPAKKKRTGLDPFTKQERVFAAKPATVRVKARALKKLKDAAL